MPVVKAQLLAFLVYTTPASLQLQLQGMGPVEQLAEDSEEELSSVSLEEMLPEPHPVLHRLVSFDAGIGSPKRQQIKHSKCTYPSDIMLDISKGKVLLETPVIMWLGMRSSSGASMARLSCLCVE